LRKLLKKWIRGIKIVVALNPSVVQYWKKSVFQIFLSTDISSKFKTNLDLLREYFLTASLDACSLHFVIFYIRYKTDA